MGTIFMASLSSIGTAAALAASGCYLHRRGYITSSGKSFLARYSQQVALPALFFSKMVSCPETSTTTTSTQDDMSSSSSFCPSLWDTLSLRNAWILILWPLVVVSCGLTVGWLACWVSQTPMWQRRSVMVAVAFANSTGLPTTLLAVLQEHATFAAAAAAGSSSSPLFFLLGGGSTSNPDPNLILSLYLIGYPMLQWSIGGWLLSSSPSSSSSSSTNTIKHDKEDLLTGTTKQDEEDLEDIPLVLNSAESSLDEGDGNAAGSMELTLTHQHQKQQHGDALNLNLDEVALHDDKSHNAVQDSKSLLHCNGGGGGSSRIHHHVVEDEETAGTANWSADSSFDSTSSRSSIGSSTGGGDPLQHHHQHHRRRSHDVRATTTTLWNTYLQPISQVIYKNVLQQPPVCGALLGLLVASCPPLRNLFLATTTTTIITTTTTVTGSELVPLHTSHPHHAPLEWLLEAIRTLGRAAVPVNMAVLGVNLSIAASSSSSSSSSLSYSLSSCSDGSEQRSNRNPSFRRTTTTTTSLVATTTKQVQSKQGRGWVSYATIWAVVIGKLIVMPLLGFWIVPMVSMMASASVVSNENNNNNNSEDDMMRRMEPLPATALLVMMMVFLTPTSNTVMVMVDLVQGGSGSSSHSTDGGVKEEMARIMAWEYVFAPFLLSGTVALAVRMAAAQDAIG